MKTFQENQKVMDLSIMVISTVSLEICVLIAFFSFPFSFSPNMIFVGSMPVGIYIYILAKRKSMHVGNQRGTHAFLCGC